MSELKLTLKKEWFDMILSGEKKEEYREIKPYWIKRFMQPPFSFMDKNEYDVIHSIDACPNDSLKRFKTILFVNGYSKTAPRFTIECKGIAVKEGYSSWGAVHDTNYFVITLGELITSEYIKS